MIEQCQFVVQEQSTHPVAIGEFSSHGNGARARVKIQQLNVNNFVFS